MADTGDTPARLVEAMEALLRRCSYDSITVADVTNECGLSRTAFCKHFRDKDELCRRMFENLCAKSVVPRRAYTWESLARQYIAALDENRDVYRTLAKARLANDRHVLFTSIYDPVFNMYRVMAEHRLGAALDQGFLFILESYCIGGIYLLTELIERGEPLDAGHLVRLYRRSMPPEVSRLLLDYEFPADVRIRP